MGTTEEIRAGVVLGMYSALDEFTQVNGTVFILDFTGITAKHLTRWKLEDIKKWSKLWQVCMAKYQKIVNTIGWRNQGNGENYGW